MSLRQKKIFLLKKIQRLNLNHTLQTVIKSSRQQLTLRKRFSSWVRKPTRLQSNSFMRASSAGVKTIDGGLALK